MEDVHVEKGVKDLKMVSFIVLLLKQFCLKQLLLTIWMGQNVLKMVGIIL